jgi:iron(III) transport system permease protein
MPPSLAGAGASGETVLPGYALQTALLALGVASGTLLVGGGHGDAGELFEFPRRRWLEWALLLPLAMPAYVLAYAYTDALQFSRPLAERLRHLVWAPGSAVARRAQPARGAVLLFVLCLYPYVYLLVRTALAERAAAMMEAARMLGAATAPARAARWRCRWRARRWRPAWRWR